MHVLLTMFFWAWKSPANLAGLAALGGDVNDLADSDANRHHAVVHVILRVGSGLARQGEFFRSAIGENLALVRRVTGIRSALAEAFGVLLVRDNGIQGANVSGIRAVDLHGGKLRRG